MKQGRVLVPIMFPKTPKSKLSLLKIPATASVLTSNLRRTRLDRTRMIYTMILAWEYLLGQNPTASGEIPLSPCRINQKLMVCIWIPRLL